MALGQTMPLEDNFFLKLLIADQLCGKILRLIYRKMKNQNGKRQKCFYLAKKISIGIGMSLLLHYTQYIWIYCLQQKIVFFKWHLLIEVIFLFNQCGPNCFVVNEYISKRYIMASQNICSLIQKFPNTADTESLDRCG